MINLFKKLQRENLLKKDGKLLDLGCGDGKISASFFEFGYEPTLVDKDGKMLLKAEDNLTKIKDGEFQVLNLDIKDFKFDKFYDGIIASNVLPFQKDKDSVSKIVNEAFEKLNKGGFLFFTLFGTKDQWAKEHPDTMSFYEKDEVLGILKAEPYYVSEDYGMGSTMKGEIKTWHIFCLLYIK
jgi:SAM-dependent methyltransferase